MKIFVFKPDGIGDFVLATGAIRLLAAEFGEDRLTIAVLPPVAALAAREFPRARIVCLPLSSKRKVLNLFLANLLQIFPVWLALLSERFDVVLSLRHSRKFLHSFFLAGLRSRRRVLAENQFSSGGHPARGGVEKFLWIVRPATVIPYPKASSGPLEFEMHRLLVREILPAEPASSAMLPRMSGVGASSSPGAGETGPIILCPFSSMKSKDYPATSWVEVFARLPQAARDMPVELAGDEAQRPALDSLAGELRTIGFPHASVREREGLPDFVSAIAGARLVLTVDTAAAHISCALGRPTIVLFSGLHRGVYAPWSPGEQQLWLEPAPPAPEDPPRKKSHWHKGIPPAKVAEHIAQLLAF